MENHRPGRFIYWAPRALSIVFIAFLALFSLDVFEPGLSAGQIIVGLLMHNIPVFVLAAVVAVAWRREIVGAAVFFLAGLLYILFAAVNAPVPGMAILWSVLIAGPALLVGWLYLMNWRRKKRGQI